MSALVAAPGESTRDSARPDRGSRPDLRPLASPGRRMARLPFLVVLIAAFGLGMAGLLLLNTTLQNQEFEARRLNSQATQLTYVQDDLESQLQMLSSPASLAQKAYAQGLRPNVHAAFLVLPDGTVKGKPQATKGTEMGLLEPGRGERLTADRAASEAEKKAALAAEEAAAVAVAQAAAQTAAQASGAPGATDPSASASPSTPPSTATSR